MRAPSSSHLLLLLGLTSAGCNGSAEKAELASRSAALIDESLLLPAVSDGAQPVIVNLAVAPLGTTNERSAAIAAAQEALIAKQIPGFSLGRRYKHVPALSGQATQQAITQLASEPGVTFVQRDSPGGGQLKEAVPAIGGDQVRSLFGLTGKGVRVAVLDTGIDTDHPDLKSSLVGQHCFTQLACPGFTREGTSAEDDHGHGSNVAGIIASDGVVSSRGFAPEAELIAVKINDSNDSGVESDWVAGMDWLFDNLASNKVRVVNLSIGTTAMHAGGAAECDRAHPALAAAIKNLVDAGVTVFAATGNRGSSTTMPAPACNTGVIAVGAVYDSAVGKQPPANVGSTYSARWGAAFANCSDANAQFDTIACFTNSTARMDILAPGAPILSDSLRGRTELYWGTSQAAPVAAGVAALMLECNPNLTPAQIKQAMVSTGVKRTDMRNGLSFPSLRALDAVKAVCDEELPTGDAGALLPDGGGVVVPDAGASPEAGVPGSLPDAGGAKPDAGGTAVDASTTPMGPTLPADAAAPPVLGADASTATQGGTGVVPPPGEAGNEDCDCAAAGLPSKRAHTRGLWLGLFGLVSLSIRRRARPARAPRQSRS